MDELEQQMCWLECEERTLKALLSFLKNDVGQLFNVTKILNVTYLMAQAFF